MSCGSQRRHEWWPFPPSYSVLRCSIEEPLRGLVRNKFGGRPRVIARHHATAGLKTQATTHAWNREWAAGCSGRGNFAWTGKVSSSPGPFDHRETACTKRSNSYGTAGLCRRSSLADRQEPRPVRRNSSGSRWPGPLVFRWAGLEPPGWHCCCRRARHYSHRRCSHSHCNQYCNRCYSTSFARHNIVELGIVGLGNIVDRRMHFPNSPAFPRLPRRPLQRTSSCCTSFQAEACVANSTSDGVETTVARPDCSGNYLSRSSAQVSRFTCRAPLNGPSLMRGWKACQLELTGWRTRPGWGS